jgi:hypothetical protein
MEVEDSLKQLVTDRCWKSENSHNVNIVAVKYLCVRFN